MPARTTRVEFWKTSNVFGAVREKSLIWGEMA